jgi:hypothetical protein
VSRRRRRQARGQRNIGRGPRGSRLREDLALDVWRYATELDPIADPVLLTLKAHVLAERSLYDLLSRRLRVDVHDLPHLGFYALARLALSRIAGAASVEPLVLELYRLRNVCAHSWEVPNLDDEIDAFLRKCAAVGFAVGSPQGRLDSYVYALKNLVAQVNSAVLSLMTPAERHAFFERLKLVSTAPNLDPGGR